MVETKTKTTTTVKVTEDKKTGQVTVTDVTPIIKVPSRPRPLSTTETKSDSYGNVQVITTNTQIIQESTEIKTVMQTIVKEKPQLSMLTPVAVKTVTYGNTEESTIVLVAEGKQSVQITTTYDKTTNVVSLVSSKMLPIIYQPWVQIVPVSPIQFIPITYLPIFRVKVPEMDQILKIL